MQSLRGSLQHSSLSTASKAKKPTTLWGKAYNTLHRYFSAIFGFGRRFLWIGSTGIKLNTHFLHNLALILMFMPLVFGYMSAMEEEMRKMQMSGQFGMDRGF